MRQLNGSHVRSVRASEASRSTTWCGVTTAVALVVLCIAAAACGDSPSSSGVASLGSTTTTTVAPASQGVTNSAYYAAVVKFSECMRDHGVPDYPDPNAQTDKVGALALQQAGVDPNSSQFQAANKVCFHLLPSSPPPEVPGELTQALRWVQCMRDHGVPNEPDPTTSQTSGEGVTLGGGLQLMFPAGVDPNSSVFQAAWSACQSLAPVGMPSTLPSAPGKPRAAK
jgi:hypothetical protein